VLGHIVENDVTLAALEGRLATLPGVSWRLGRRVAGLEASPDGYRVRLADGRRLAAPLVVAADGARSPLREMAGIATREHDTGHVALVTTVRVARDHGEVARQA
ncbi:FAD-dependent monooxygenase, partial [Staphylococcus aureus]|uniref:FAD-dependent monooxygenase n=1 Tax=Staphylococcus aureus TaxID=1280 RepID=UPI00301D0CA5